MPRPKRKPDPSTLHAADDAVAAAMRARRKQLRLTLAEVGEAIGATFQQVHKYETGRIRMSAGRLYLVAQALNWPVENFYAAAGKQARR